MYCRLDQIAIKIMGNSLVPVSADRFKSLALTLSAGWQGVTVRKLRNRLHTVNLGLLIDDTDHFVNEMN